MTQFMPGGRYPVEIFDTSFALQSSTRQTENVDYLCKNSRRSETFFAAGSPPSVTYQLDPFYELDH